MRTSYLVTYDISDPDRLRKVFKVMKRFGDHVQLSVFRCDLNGRELIRLKAALVPVMNQNADQVLFADIGPEEGRGQTAIEALGRPYEVIERQAVVI